MGKVQKDPTNKLSALSDVLKHPCIKLKAVTGDLYKSKEPADIQRLRSRVYEIHRYTHDEFVALKRLIEKKYLPYLLRMAKAPEKLTLNDYPDWLKLKNLLLEAGTSTGWSYNYFYDRLRKRAKISNEEMKQIAQAFHHLADYMEERMQVAKVQFRDYQESTGRGGRNDKIPT